MSKLADNLWEIVKGDLLSKWTKDVNPKKPLPEYPRPQFVRKEWFNLNGLWDYAILPKQELFVRKFDGKILVPFPIESALSGVKEKLKPNQKLWYRRFFSIPDSWGNKEVLLNFGAVDWETTVWINDLQIGSHKGGYTPFSFNITEYLNEGENEIIISVWDPTNKGYQERGKQTLRPFLAFYSAVSGIWQTVWLESVPKSRMANVKITPDVDHDCIELLFYGTNVPKQDNIEISIKKGKKEITSEICKINDSICLKIPNPKLWSCDHPFLYDISFRISRKNKIVDEVNSYFGMRKISIKKDSKNIPRIALNDEILFQYGTLDQGYFPDGLYTAPTDAALRYDIEITKELGFNMIRKHVKVEPARWYYHCDKLGIPVWQDMPNGGSIFSGSFGLLTAGKCVLPFGRIKEENRINYLQELREMILFLYNSPSVICWIPFNEGWGQFKTAEVVDSIKRLDSSRLINNASGGVDKGLGDIKDIHRYPGPKIPKIEEERAAVLGEFGGLAFFMEKNTWDMKFKWGYRKCQFKEELKNKYVDLITKLKELKSKGLAAAVYTQITDIEGEINGLLTYDRKKIKIHKSSLRKINKKLINS